MAQTPPIPLQEIKQEKEDNIHYNNNNNNNNNVLNVHVNDDRMTIPSTPYQADENGEDDDERQELMLDDLDDLDDSEFQFDATPSTTSSQRTTTTTTTPSTTPPKKHKETKLSNKSQPFPLPSEFYLYSPLGKLDKCMQCREAFTTSYMLAKHIEKVHPKQIKNPKPIPFSSTSTTTSTSSTSTESPASLATLTAPKRRGRPPRKPMNSYPAHVPKPPTSETTSNTTITKEESAPKRRKRNPSTNNNKSKLPSTTDTAPTHIFDPHTEDKKVYTSSTNHTDQSTSSPNNKIINDSPPNVPKMINLEQLSQKIENLSMLRKIADQGLISEQQYKQKQEEFLLSVQFF